MSDTKEIKAGDVVQLKSEFLGRNKMTVEQIKNNTAQSENETAECVWFDGNAQIYRQGIRTAALKVVDEN